MVGVETAAGPSSRASGGAHDDPRSRFRPEVQGLRAVAVGLVVVYHLWPLRLPGGFVGVDVFFVISGFLITSHLVRDVARSGRVRLGSFWSRRVRRLLPASLLVLAVCTVLAIVWVPTTQWAATARQLVASALYVQNWALAADSVDYLALGNEPTLVQHFWSLSVEEQFYVLWPSLLALSLWLAGRRRGGRPDPVRTTAWLVGAIGIASLLFSLWWTPAEPAWSYFATPTRLWELALGALLAVLPLARLARWGRARVALGWAGLVAIVVSAFLIDGGMPFPGWVALVPTLGAAAIIAAGASGSRFGGDRVLSWRPATFIGDVSYSLYLWHWPMIVAAPFALGRTLAWPDKLAIAAVSVLLAWATKVWVEDRFRRSPSLAGNGRAFRFTAVAMAVVVAAGLGLGAGLQARAQRAEQEYAAGIGTDCFGPSALLDPGCGAPMGDGSLAIAVETLSLQNTEPLWAHCQATLPSTQMVSCRLGSQDPTPSATIVLIGDSHTTQWFSAFDELGREHGWRIDTYTKSSCPATAAERVLPDEEPDRLERCRSWLAEVDATIRERDDVDMIVTTAYSSAYAYVQPRDDRLGDPAAMATDPAVAGFATMWQRWLDDGIPVTAIAAVPRTQGGMVPDCLAANPDDFSACAVPRPEAVPPDPIIAAGLETGVPVIDLTDSFCDAQLCYPVVGTVPVYRDYSHLSEQYSVLLAPQLAAMVGPLLVG